MAGGRRYCALEHALEEAPIPLEDAARLYNRRYRSVREAVAESAAVRSGDVEILGAARPSICPSMSVTRCR